MRYLILFLFSLALAGPALPEEDSASFEFGGDSFLAGRTLTGGYIAGSLMLTNLSTEQLVGLNGDAFRDGLCVMAWEVVSGVSLVIMALFFLPRYLASGICVRRCCQRGHAADGISGGQHGSRYRREDRL